MVPTKELVGFTFKCDITKITLNNSRRHIISKMTHLFNCDVKSFMTFNTPDTLHKWIGCKKVSGTEISKYLQKLYWNGVG